MTDPLRIALITDTHYWPGSTQRFGGQGSQLQPWSEQIQQTLLAQIAQAKPDYLFHLGDMTCGGGSFGMGAEPVLQTLASTFAQFTSLHIPFYALPGNHDSPLGSRWSLFEELAGLEPGIGKSVEWGDLLLVLLHSQGHSPAQIQAALPNDPVVGWVAEAELARLDQTLAAVGDRPVLLFCHQLLHPFGGDQEWREFYEIANRAAVLEILARHANVRAVFQGHAHRLDVQTVSLGGQPCTFVVAPAIMEYPLAWLLLEVQDQRLTVSLQRLPLPDLAESSRTIGEDISWRAGKPEWETVEVGLG